MRLATRAYVDKKIIDGEGGEHSRVVDVAELDMETARSQVEGLLEDDEEINQMVSVWLSDQDPVM